MWKKGLACFLLLAAALCMGVSAAEDVPYTTYTYSLKGDPVKSPHAWLPSEVISTVGTEAGALSQPADLVVDGEGRLYVSDTGNNRIVILNSDFTVRQVLKDFTWNGEAQTLTAPLGLFRTAGGRLYVADSQNNRLVVFDEDGACVDMIGTPASGDLPADFVFIPSAVSVDSSGMMFVVSKGCVYGIVTISPDHSFAGFLGAQDVTVSAADRFWRLFLSKAQKKKQMKVVPANYNNIDIDASGFLYATSVVSDSQAAAAVIVSRSKDSANAPIKKLNPEGTDVLTRNGFFPPAGDARILFSHSTVSDSNLLGPSIIGDVSVSNMGLYSLLDTKRNKIFTYDNDGNLLCVFGGSGYQKGSFIQTTALTCFGDRLFVLDGSTGLITAFDPTEYGQLLIQAIGLTQERKYSEAVAVWRQVLLENGSFDMAYKGIGDSLYRDRDYQGAMSYYRQAGDTASYSKAYGQWRGQSAGKVVLLIPLLLAALAFGIARFFRFVRRFNAAHVAGGNETMGAQVVYGFHTLLHPFDGFWDGKREKRAGMKGAMVFLGLAVISVVIHSVAKGFVFSDPGGDLPNPLTGAVAVLMVIVLWCVANWCLTALMDGSGSMKDIFIMTCYSLLPMTLMYIPATALSYALTAEESIFLTLITAIGILWTAFLLIIGTMTIHEYSFGKNLLTVLLTLAGMVLIAFVGFLLLNLVGRMGKFAQNIINEIRFRS